MHRERANGGEEKERMVKTQQGVVYNGRKTITKYTMPSPVEFMALSHIIGRESYKEKKITFRLTQAEKLSFFFHVFSVARVGLIGHNKPLYRGFCWQSVIERIYGFMSVFFSFLDVFFGCVDIGVVYFTG